MRAPVILVVAGATSLHDQSLPTLVKYLGHAGQKLVAGHAFKEAHSHITGGYWRGLTGETPRYASCFVVKSRMEVPRSGSLVLQAPAGSASAGRSPVSVWS